MTTTAVRTAVRATTADAALVARRRARHDAGLLTLSAVLLAVTVLLAVAVPRLVERAADDTVRELVTQGRPATDVVAEPGARVGAARPTSRDEDVPILLANSATELRSRLPDALHDVTGRPVTSVSSALGPADIDGTRYATRLVHVGTPGDDSPLVRWTQGAAPVGEPTVVLPGGTPEGSWVEVGVSAAVAQATGIGVGDHFVVPGATYGTVNALVSGVFEPVDPAALVWTAQDDVLGPIAAPAGTPADSRIAFLLSDDALPDVYVVLQQRGLSTVYRYPVRTERLTAQRTGAVEEAVARVTTGAESLMLPDGRVPSVSTSLGAVLVAADGRLAAARAQASVLLVGLAVVGALALVLAARLLVLRREPLVLAERARGASVASVAARALVETVPLVLVAASVGGVAGWLLVPGVPGDLTIAVAVIAVAVLAPAVWASLAVARAWSGRREPANRTDRERLRRRRGVRRLVTELALVAVAAAALVSVRGRGLLQTRTGDVDVLLAATPALLAAALTVLAGRALPPVLRSLSRAATRRRGLVPVVATARASRTAGTAVPLLTLATAVGLVVFCGTIAQTVVASQSVAADLVVGADVRLDGPVSPEDVDALRAAPGVTAVAGATELGDRSLGIGSGVPVRVVAVDAEPYAAIRAAHGLDVPDGLATLGEGTGTGVPALATPDAARTAAIVDPQVRVVKTYATMDVVGTVDSVPALAAGAVGGTVDPDDVGAMIVDRTRLTAGGEALETDVVWVDGPGAADAVRAIGLDHAAEVTVTERDAWLTAWRDAPLTTALLALLVATALVLAGYAAVALVLTVVATARERGRTVSSLRTMGLDGRTALALTLGELAPLAIAAVVTGVAIGVVVPWLLTDALGLDVLAGAPGAAQLELGWLPGVGATLVVAAALLVAVLVEQVVRRRDRLGEVLRVGER